MLDNRNQTCMHLIYSNFMIDVFFPKTINTSDCIILIYISYGGNYKPPIRSNYECKTRNIYYECSYF